MMRLKSKLLSLNASKTTKVKVFSPRNCEELRIPFKSDKTAKVVGKLASIPPPLPEKNLDEDGDTNIDGSNSNSNTEPPPLVSGVLVQNDFKLSLMAPEDLREYAGLSTTTITCKQRLRLSAAGLDLIKWALEGTFGTIEELPEMRHAIQAVNGDKETTENDEAEAGAEKDDDETATKEEAADEEVAQLVAAYLVMGCVSVRYRTNGDVELEWEANLLSDGIADSVMAVLFSVESSPAAVKRSSSKHTHSYEVEETGPGVGANPHANPSPADRLERLLWFLEAQFGADNVAPVETPKTAAVEATATATAAAAAKTDGDGDEGGKGSKEDDAEDNGEGEEERLKARNAKEIERLHKIGIPVPGVCITVDKMRATVWLEDLEVECNNKVFADRVRAVVERAVEVTAPLWG